MEHSEVMYWISRGRAKCYDVSLDKVITTMPDAYVQLKYDGWWGLVVVEKGVVRAYSVGGKQLFFYKDERFSTTDFIGVAELGYGTNWAINNFAGRIATHDLLAERETLSESWVDLTLMDYSYRYSELEKLFYVAQDKLEERMFLITNYSVDKIPNLISLYMPHWEGFVFKSPSSHIGEGFPRWKRHVTGDFLLVNMVEGNGKHKGRLGAFVGGLYKGGKLIAICSVGGGFTDAQREEYWKNKDRYLGRVFQASGKARFDSGALRHPNFDRWRDDKDPKECTWEALAL